MLLAFVVVVLGAYTRLSDAGLGCPDWPGCYGNVMVPDVQEEIDQSNEIYMSRPLEAGKAWKEMVHRYAAGTLGILILVIAILAWRARSQPGQQLTVPLLLVGLVIFQALLGMWTVTLLLKPIIVMGHLLGGMTILALLTWTYLKCRSGTPAIRTKQHPLRFWSLLGLIIVAVQISLGGWTGANYAALICPDLPVCQGQWWPPMDFSEGFIPWRGLGVNYEFGVLEGPARTAVHMSHRLGAVITLLVVAFIAVRSILDACLNVRRAGSILLALLIVQFSLGVANVLLTLPIMVAVAHNGVAALLLLSILTLVFHTRYATTA
ncbi:MAG: cytochrome B [Gammaproteobacteria bacterium RIFCSPLOWO2_02_FULL_52_10]|nr:MAG: cytochrome B [Gammaproteobacteria bacterium RIFCSPLOWO2_02_FULL_52_10]